MPMRFSRKMAKRNKRILHIAPANISNVPGTLVLTERRMGFDSRLVTLYRDRRRYFEDICLDLPFIQFPGVRWVKTKVSAPEKLQVDNVLRIPEQIPRRWQPHTCSEGTLVWLRDAVWRPKIEHAIRSYHLDEFDVYQLDGGLDLYRHAGFIRRMKTRRRTVICCYTGSDLRTRGVIPAIDELADVNCTFEYDHLLLHPHIHHIFFPFDAAPFQRVRRSPSHPVRVGHAPTQRGAKGSGVILSILAELAKTLPFEVVLIENLTHAQALAKKSSCDIFIDQIGDLGYGINSLESLAMGIATCSCLAPGFADAYPDHPFVVIDAGNLADQIRRLITEPEWREEMGDRGYDWVRRVHRADAAVSAIHRLAGI